MGKGVERQLEIPFGLPRVPCARSYREEVVLLESYLLGKIREKGRHAYHNRMPDEQMELDL
jgi:hypothetical protein